jgi:hypothetical protein
MMGRHTQKKGTLISNSNEPKSRLIFRFFFLFCSCCYLDFLVVGEEFLFKKYDFSFLEKSGNVKDDDREERACFTGTREFDKVIPKRKSEAKYFKCR